MCPAKQTLMVSNYRIGYFPPPTITHTDDPNTIHYIPSVTLPTVLRKARPKTPKSWNDNLRYETAEPAEKSVHYSAVRCCHPQGLSLTNDNSEIDRRRDDKSNTALFRQIGSTRKSLTHA